MTPDNVTAEFVNGDIVFSRTDTGKHIMKITKDEVVFYTPVKEAVAPAVTTEGY